MIGQYVRLAAGTLRTRLQGQREQQPINVVNNVQQAAAPAKRKRTSGGRLRADGVTDDEIATIRTMYRGGVKVADIAAATGRSHTAIYQAASDLPRRLDKGLGPRALALYDAGRTFPQIAAELGIGYGRAWALIDRRLKRRGE